jgi:hypothetical protein
MFALATLAASAHASDPCPASYPHPARASLVKAPLVQAFVQCTCGYSGVGGNTPNTTTEGGIPSCYPAETFDGRSGSPSHGWHWGPHAQGSVSLKAGKNTLLGPAYPLNLDPEAADLRITVKLSEILDEQGFVDHRTGHFSMVLRMTLVDRAHDQPVTAVDLPIGFPIEAVGGKASLKTSLSAALAGLMMPALPRCTTIELIDALVQDPNGAYFATFGSYLP